MTKHTPGPWKVYAQPISGKADAILESIEQVQATDIIADHIYLIDAGGKCAAIAGCGPTSEANAYLVAAAPDLLEAVYILQHHSNLQFPHEDPDYEKDIAFMQAAIAKAEGRT